MNYDEVTDEEIKSKYLKAPTLQQIKEFVEGQKITYAQFERYYSMPAGIMRQVKTGNRNLPVKFWAIVYEKIVPQYGTSLKELNRIIFKKNVVTKNVTINSYSVNENHDRITKIE